jgi:UDP-glucose 4-epimerase
MNCLVLGGGGFQGIHLCHRLLSEGAHIRVLDRHALDPGVLPTRRLDWQVGEFSDIDLLERCVSDIDVIFHLISTTLPKTSNENPLHDLESNVLPTLRLLDLVSLKGVKKVIFFSSGGTVYGVPETLPIAEGHPTRPICAYGIHKLAIEKYLHLYHVLHGVDYAIMRIANPYGANQSVDRGQGAIGVFLYKMFAGEPVEVWGDGSAVRDYIHVDDVVEAVVRLIAYKGTHKIFNIGSGRGLSINEIIAIITKALRRQPMIRYQPGRALDVPANVLDIRRAEHELGWHPKISIEEGIRMCVKSCGVPEGVV